MSTQHAEPASDGAQRLLDLPAARRPGRLTARRRRAAPSRPAEAAAAVALCVAGSVAILGSFVGAGGRYLDDWWFGVNIRFPHAMGFGRAADYLTFYSGQRPGAIAYWVTTYDLFGFHDDWHRATSVVLGDGLAAAGYLLVRELGLARPDAAAIALLTLVLPVADAIHFWMTPAVAQLCLTACALGLLVGLRALRADGRAALRLHAVSLALFAGSLLMAETMLPAIALSLLFYRTRASWRKAAARWWADLLLVGVATIHYAVSSPRRLAGDGQSGVVAHAQAIADQLPTLLTSILAPYAPARGYVLAGLLVGAALVALRFARARRAGADTRATRVWVVTAGLAALVAAASYAIYVPADSSYLPLAPGVGNRMNIGALLPLAVLAYAVVRLLGGLVAQPRARAALTLGLLVAVAGPALHRLRADRALWIAAASQQDFVLSAVRESLPSPPRGSALIVLNAPGVVTRFGPIGHVSVNQSVPVFSTWWELDAAVKLAYGRADVAAYPIWADQAPQIICGAHRLYQLGLDGVRHALAYGHVYIVDVLEPRATRVDDQRLCVSVTSTQATVRYDLPV